MLIVAVSITSKENSELKIVFELSKPKQPIINKITHGINKIVCDDKSVNIFILKNNLKIHYLILSFKKKK